MGVYEPLASGSALFMGSSRRHGIKIRSDQDYIWVAGRSPSIPNPPKVYLRPCWRDAGCISKPGWDATRPRGADIGSVSAVAVTDLTGKHGAARANGLAGLEQLHCRCRWAATDGGVAGVLRKQKEAIALISS